LPSDVKRFAAAAPRRDGDHEFRDAGVLHAYPGQVRHGDFLLRRAPPIEPRGDVAELRVHVRRTEDARLDGMMDLSEPHALIESVRDDLVCFLEDLDLELLLIRTVRADGRDVCARPDPFRPDERLPG